jgi:hypothetical protein
MTDFVDNYVAMNSFPNAHHLPHMFIKNRLFVSMYQDQHEVWKGEEAGK